MPTLAFLTAVYNEEAEIYDLLRSVRPYVDTTIVSDDGSTDRTIQVAVMSKLTDVLVLGPHLASCEEVRIRGFSRVAEDWVLILDADERITPEDLQKMRDSLEDLDNRGITHVYFSQEEFIDDQRMRSFAKIKLARREHLNLPIGLHDDVSATGKGDDLGLRVYHRKTKQKQIMRETEYLSAYRRKIAEGKMTPERAAQVSNWHYYVKPHG